MFPIRDTIPAKNPPIATWFLILANCCVFLFELTLSPQQLQQLFYFFGIVPARFSHPDWAQWVGFPIDDYWPFLTSMFLHGGWMHIIGNMWTLWIFGDNVEDRLGPVRFLFFYLLCGFVAGFRAIHLTDNKVPIDIVLHTPGGLLPNAAKRRKKIAQRVSAGVWCWHTLQPQRGDRLKFCRRFAACLAREIKPRARALGYESTTGAAIVYQ